MRRRTWSAVTALVAGVLALGMGLPASGGFSSDGVEWVANIATHTGTSGGILHGDHYYLTDPRGVYIYDVADPTDPQLVGELPAMQMGAGVALAQEEPDTNGEILLVDAVAPTSWSTTQSLTGKRAMHPQSPTPTAQLRVVDVSDVTDPDVIGTLDVDDHTWTCVLECTYAYGRDGYVIDLTDPRNPEEVADWREVIGSEDDPHAGYMHDFTEVAPGRLVGSGQPALYLDVTDPREPVELARIDPGFHTFGYHGAVWPNDATDRFLLMGAEIAPKLPIENVTVMQYAGSDCDDESAYALATYDARSVVEADELRFNARSDQGRDSGRKAGHERKHADASFVKLHEWRIEGRGGYVDGNAPAHTLYCGHWFDAHPTWQDGGLLAIAHYDWGTRFLDVDDEGAFEQVGWFQPIGGHTGAAKWITDDVVYVHDYRRGLDILQVELTP